MERGKNIKMAEAQDLLEEQAGVKKYLNFYWHGEEKRQETIIKNL